MAKRRPRPGPTSDRSPLFVASTLPGTHDLAQAEIIRRSRGRVNFSRSLRDDEWRFALESDTDFLSQLRLTQTIHRSLVLDVKGPGSFMSDHYDRCLSLIRSSMSLTDYQNWEEIRFDAAGSNSETFNAFGAKLSESFGIRYAPNSGDLLITVRPSKPGWEFMCRIGNRPLGTRPWREGDLRGAMNATLAAAMVELSGPTKDDVFCNLMCGTGTLAIERLLRRGVQSAVGVDVSRRILKKAAQNADAARIGPRIQLIQGDVAAVPLPDATFNVICADLPWGEAVGDRRSNVVLYEQFFQEAYRIGKPDARLLILTLDTPALDEIGPKIGPLFERLETRQFSQRGYRSQCVRYRHLGL